MPKRFVERNTQVERAKQRQKLGTLKDLTVQPSTKARYNAAIDGFLRFLRDNQLSLPKQRHLLDGLVCEYLEHLWSEGYGRALASDTVAGLQDQDPKIRGHLQGSWRLLKTWSINEIPNRAPPLPCHVLHAMVGWAIFHGHGTFAVSLLMGFYSMLRTGELLNLKSSHVMCDASQDKVLLSLGFTKGGKRQGAAESCVIGYDVVVRFVKYWKTMASPSTGFASSPANWRKLFNQALQALDLQSFSFRPYSLRRGGATWWFNKHHSLDQILVQGRWQAAKTARIYLNDGLALLAELQLPASRPSLAPFLTIFRNHKSVPRFSTLEPPCKKHGRSGGSGKNLKKRPKSGKSRPKKRFLCPERMISFMIFPLTRWIGGFGPIPLERCDENMEMAPRVWPGFHARTYLFLGGMKFLFCFNKCAAKWK